MRSRVAVPLVLFVVGSACVSPAPGEKIYGKVWLEKYVPGDPVTEEQEAWAAEANMAKCYICHVKGKSKKCCNTYGDALSQWLKSDNYGEDRVKAEEEAVKAEIRAALEKAESTKDDCNTEFRALFAEYNLPSAEIGSASVAKAQVAEDGDEDQAE